LAPVSNGNIALMSDLARHDQFPWDAILGADLARNYKPRPEVYRGAVKAFNLEPMMQLIGVGFAAEWALDGNGVVSRLANGISSDL
jgi:hypothetical protein